MNNLEVAEVLEQAADLYESGRVDWCRGAYVRGSGSDLSVCSLGSIRLTLVGGNEDDLKHFAKDPQAPKWNKVVQIESILNKELKRRGVFTPIHNHYGVGTWNDQIADGKQDVIDLFKETAKDLRNEG